VLALAGCGSLQGSGAKQASAGHTSLTATPKTPDKLAGALAVFVTVSGGAQTSSVYVDNQRYSLDSDSYAVVRVVPGQPGVVIDKDTSYSFAKSYIEPVVANGKLYVARIGTETGSLSLTEHDPRSGKILGEVCSLYSMDPRDAVAIVGGRIYFITPIGHDLLGRYTGGGDIAYYDLPCSGEPHILTPADKITTKSPSGLHTVAGNLFADVFNNGVRGLFRVDLTTGAFSDFAAFKTASMRPDQFYDGDDAFYFLLQLDNGNLGVARLPLEGTSAVKGIGEIPLTGKFEWACADAAGGETFVSVSDPDPRFFLIDKVGSMTTLNLDPGLFGQTACGQLMRLP
jgi:hypothetical protein